MTDITINPASDTATTYEHADTSRVQQLAAENTELRETYQQAMEEAARLRDAVEAQADTITALEEEAKDRELFVEQLYGCLDVLIHGRRRR